ncbi:MAG: inositol monophosphatase [Pseudomonadota bacterium]
MTESGIDIELLDNVEALMRDVATEHILPRFRSLAEGEVEAKTGPQDLVTVADREAEEALIPALEALVPGSRVVGEEGVSLGTVSTDLLLGDSPVWLVDPVDGTYNFVQGSERFGVMVALCRRQVVEAGWILFPVDGRCLRAARGQGAIFGGELLKTPQAKRFEQAHGDYSHAYVEEPYRSAFLQATEHAAGVRQGRCSAYAYGDLARGLIDCVVQYQMTPWDHAAGQLIVEEAGGRFGFLPGGEPYTPIAHPSRPMLSVGNTSVWEDYAKRMRSVLPSNLT